MDPESKKLLEDNLKLSEENNAMLRKLLRSMHVRRILSVLYWAIIIGSTIGAFYFIQPYIDQLKDAYGGAKNNFNGFNEILDSFKNNPPR